MGKSTAQAKSDALAVEGIIKSSSMIRCEELEIESAGERQYLKNRIIEIWIILHPLEDPAINLHLAVGDHRANTTEQDALRQQLTDMIRELRETARADVNKAAALLTERNNELMAANQRFAALASSVGSEKEIHASAVRAKDERVAEQSRNIMALTERLEESASLHRNERFEHQRQVFDMSAMIDRLRATVHTMIEEFQLKSHESSVLERRLAHRESELNRGELKRVSAELRQAGWNSEGPRQSNIKEQP